MEYSRLVAVTGMPGLFEVVTSKNDGAIVRSLEDKSTKFLSSRVHNLSHLESIEIYTTGENVNLVDVFNAMKDSKTALPDTKDNAAIKKYFESVFPDMDFERVYASDMKKMVKWYEVLQKNKVDIKLSEPEEEEAEETTSAEETTTKLKVSGDDTAETAKPKTTKKVNEEDDTKGSKAKPAASKEAKTKSAPSKEAKAKSAPSKEAKPKSAKKKD